MYALDVLLSHSSADEKIARALINLLRDALNIEQNRIRCTSVPGYKLEIGAHTETRLCQEIQQAHIFIGLLSEVSLGSAYVLFELGARWGAMQDYGYNSANHRNKLFPILAAGATGSMMRDTLKAYNALNCESAGDLHQLIGDIGQELNRQTGSAAAYQDKIDALISASRILKAKRTREAKKKAADSGAKSAISPRSTTTKGSKTGSKSKVGRTKK